VLLGEGGEEFCPDGLKRIIERPKDMSEATGRVNKRQEGVRANLEYGSTQLVLRRCTGSSETPAEWGCQALTRDWMGEAVLGLKLLAIRTPLLLVPCCDYHLLPYGPVN
jgi:hypothetical protein